MQAYTTVHVNTHLCAGHYMYIYSILFTKNHFISDIRKMWDLTVSESTDYIHNGEQINHLVAGIKVVTQTGSTSE